MTGEAFPPPKKLSNFTKTPEMSHPYSLKTQVYKKCAQCYSLSIGSCNSVCMLVWRAKYPYLWSKNYVNSQYQMVHNLAKSQSWNSTKSSRVLGAGGGKPISTLSETLSDLWSGHHNHSHSWTEGICCLMTNFIWLTFTVFQLDQKLRASTADHWKKQKIIMQNP